ncbi:stress-induced-phosphoprotein 1 [Halyomorpha halys]|uniref:stress-induced-phosphoprotein 1 n=1 Tax=Halyomorpha halys TaxID=286706 RepID=UPI0006D4EAF2|nr:hsp70-Hsp90 organizing protein 2 [Halyomorpha halys]
MANNTEEAISWKEKGNECVKQGKYEEAVLHYGKAIRLDPNNPTLYSNRSLAFLKLQQYYYAYSDANETIKLRRDWAKGYFRKGEVEMNVGRPSDALLSYQIALHLQPADQTVKDAMTRATAACEKDKKKEQIPWLCAGVGIIIGVAIVMGDQLLTSEPSLSHPLLMALLTISIASLGYLIAIAWRFFIGCQMQSLLDPPLDLLAEMHKDDKEDDAQQPDVPAERTHARLTKAQARAKLKRQRT